MTFSSGLAIIEYITSFLVNHSTLQYFLIITRIIFYSIFKFAISSRYERGPAQFDARLFLFPRWLAVVQEAPGGTFKGQDSLFGWHWARSRSAISTAILQTSGNSLHFLHSHVHSLLFLGRELLRRTLPGRFSLLLQSCKWHFQSAPCPLPWQPVKMFVGNFSFAKFHFTAWHLAC